MFSSLGTDGYKIYSFAVIVPFGAGGRNAVATVKFFV